MQRYRQTFRQDAVLRERTAVCVAFRSASRRTAPHRPEIYVG